MLLRVLMLFVLLATPLTARAGGNVCLVDFTNGRVFSFTKLRIPKAPGAATPVAGLMVDGVATAGIPVGGTLARQLLGRVHFALEQGLLSCRIYINVDDTLSGPIHYDCNIDGTYEAESTVAPADCRDLL